MRQRLYEFERDTSSLFGVLRSSTALPSFSESPEFWTPSQALLLSGIGVSPPTMGFPRPAELRDLQPHMRCKMTARATCERNNCFGTPRAMTIRRASHHSDFATGFCTIRAPQAVWNAGPLGGGKGGGTAERAYTCTRPPPELETAIHGITASGSSRIPARFAKPTKASRASPIGLRPSCAW